MEKLQEKYDWASMTPDLDVEELLMVVYDAWAKKTDLLSREDFFAEFEKTAFGDKLRILAPVVKYANKEVSPRWVSAPRPFRSDKEVIFRGDE